MFPGVLVILAVGQTLSGYELQVSIYLCVVRVHVCKRVCVCMRVCACVRGCGVVCVCVCVCCESGAQGFTCETLLGDTSPLIFQHRLFALK